jgi:hypothetical protein
MRPRWCFLFFFSALLCPALLAAPKPPKAPSLPSGHRYLFVVDTSISAARVSYTSRQAVVDMIWSGLDGQMRPGDTYGLWTYNEEPRTGVFPMQTWTNTISLELGSQAGRFLREQSYANRPRLNRLVEKLQTVIRVVKDVDIIMVSGDGGTIINTPFDQPINAAWRDKSFYVREGKKPLITALTARNGEITGWSVTIAGEPIRLPERPATAAPVPTAPASVTNTTPKTAVATSAPPANMIMEKPRQAALPRELPSSNAATAVETAVVSQTSISAPAPVVAALAPKTESTPPLAAPEAAAPSGQRPPETPAPITAVANKLATAVPQPQPITPAAPPSSPAPSSENSVRERLAANADAAPVSLAPAAQAVVAARESATAPRPALRPEVTTELATVAPRPLFSPVTMALIGSALLLSTLALILLFVRRATPLPQPSLITQSIERARSADTLSAR